MKRVVLAINGRELHVYLDGDQVDLGRSGIAPINRRPVVTITDTLGDVTVEREVVDENGEAGVQPRYEKLTGSADVEYECAVQRIEEL